MAATIKKSKYFNEIDNLSLTADQEAELNTYVPMVNRVCSQYFMVNPALVDKDDLIQMALVRLTRAIRLGKAVELSEESKYNYYAKLVRRSCLNQLRLYKLKIQSECTYEKPHGSCSTDVDRIHDKLYIEQILESLRGTHRQEILIHYYGLDTPPLDPLYISDLVPLSPSAIAYRRFVTIESIKRQINKGELPLCHPE